MPLIITAKLSILNNCGSLGYTSDLWAATYEIPCWNKAKSTLLQKMTFANRQLRQKNLL